MQVKSIAREHSTILLTFILATFEWPFDIGFTVIKIIFSAVTKFVNYKSVLNW